MHHINPVCVMGGVRSFKCIKSGLSLKPLAEEYTHTHKKKGRLYMRLKEDTSMK